MHLKTNIVALLKAELSLLKPDRRSFMAQAHTTHHSDSHQHASTQEHSHTDHHAHHEMMFRNRFWVCLLLTIPVLLYSETLQQWLNFSMPVFAGSQWIVPVFSIIIFGYGGVPFLQMAGSELKSRQPGMMTLISLAIVVAFGYSMATVFVALDGNRFFWELVTLIDIMLLGHWFEMRSVGQASGAMNELARLMPDKAERLTANGETETVKVSELTTGEQILVRPGASVAVDGEIIKGQSELNEAMVTGESRPVKKHAGDHVIGGSINGDGSLRVKVTATGDQTTLAGIMRLVQEAQQSRSQTQLLADKAAGWLFYVALAVALITLLVWGLSSGFNVEVLKRVVTVLVIACPHALGLAIPLVIAISTTLAAKQGILIRNRIALETARRVNTVVFDKTGTLTQGEQGIVDMITTAESTEDDALTLAAAIEQDSEHSIARAFQQAAQKRQLNLPAMYQFEAIKGQGVKAWHEEQPVYVGGPNLLAQMSLQLPETFNSFVQQAQKSGHAIVYLVVNQQAQAAFALADVIRPESQQVIQQLHDMNIRVAMLTGDSQAVAQAVAEQLNIDTYFAGVLPEDKDKKITELQDKGQIVAMVGDGVNDAPALTRADVGIAIGSGTDVAIQSADIILVKNNPLDVLKIFQLSQASYRKMIQNLFWAGGYNVIALPLAAGILAPIGIVLSPAVGAIVMSLSTIVVAVNAQLLRRVALTH